MCKKYKVTTFIIKHKSNAVKKARAQDREAHTKLVRLNKTNRANVA